MIAAGAETPPGHAEHGRRTRRDNTDAGRSHGVLAVAAGDEYGRRGAPEEPRDQALRLQPRRRHGKDVDDALQACQTCRYAPSPLAGQSAEQAR